ncbi:hypothetical protein AB0880_21995 [Micromonospora chersina]|uniref:hypothetical protein n=1 Tax=Micromonospora chersina TaxID=47854 RepID=UPI0034533E4F
MDLRSLRVGFRDDAQRSRAQRVIHDRLADDRLQDECRYLMKFWWQLSMSYQEVTIGELREHLGADKLRAVEALIKAIGQTPEDIEEWITRAVGAFPLIHDRGNSRRDGRSAPPLANRRKPSKPVRGSSKPRRRALKRSRR